MPRPDAVAGTVPLSSTECVRQESLVHLISEIIKLKAPKAEQTCVFIETTFKNLNQRVLLCAAYAASFCPDVTSGPVTSEPVVMFYVRAPTSHSMLTLEYLALSFLEAFKDQVEFETHVTSLAFPCCSI